MNTKAGQGIQSVDFEKGTLWYQHRPSVVAALGQAIWQLPAGSWWQVMLVHAQADATSATADAVLSLRATSTGTQLFYLENDIILPAGLFNGGVTYGIDLGPQNWYSETSIVGQLPNVWLPPESSISLEVLTTAGTVELANPILIARAAMNL